MDKLGFAKLVVNYIVGTSAGYTAKEVIANNVQPESTADIAKAAVGSLVISSMVAGTAKAYVDNLVDEAIEFWNEQKNKSTVKTAE